MCQHLTLQLKMQLVIKLLRKLNRLKQLKLLQQQNRQTRWLKSNRDNTNKCCLLKHRWCQRLYQNNLKEIQKQIILELVTNNKRSSSYRSQQKMIWLRLNRHSLLNNKPYLKNTKEKKSLKTYHLMLNRNN